MIVYLRGSNSDQVSEILWVSKGTVQNTIEWYVKDKDNFYLTSYKWKIISNAHKETIEEVKDTVEECINWWKNPNIKTILHIINRKQHKAILTYPQCYHIIRNILKYNYQKPFVRSKHKSPHAKEIVRWRLRKAITHVCIQENDVDLSTIKNKKTKNWRNGV